MTQPKVTNCNACGDPMWWCMTPKGNRQPIDPYPSAEGNVLVVQPRGLEGVVLAVVLSGEMLKKVQAERRVPLHTAHHQTCEKWAEFKAQKQ